MGIKLKKWWTKDRINERLDALETGQLSAKGRATIGANETEITALQALQHRLEDRLNRVVEDLEQTRQAVAEGIANVTRTDNRIKATIARATKEFKKRGFESPGLEAEAVDLRPVDGTGGEEPGLPAVREALDAIPEEPSSVPGVTLAQLQRVRGVYAPRS